MKKLIFFLPILFLLACEPQPLPDLSLVNLNGSWQVEASGIVSFQDSALRLWNKQDFQISFSENGQFVLNGLGSVPRSGSYQKGQNGGLTFALPGLAIKTGFEDLNVWFQVDYNLIDKQEWQANGRGILDNQAASYCIHWHLKRIE